MGAGEITSTCLETFMLLQNNADLLAVIFAEGKYYEPLSLYY